MAVPPNQENPFADWTEEQIERHCRKSRYGDFRLTDGIRPSPTFIPRQGYTLGEYHDRDTGGDIPFIMAAASREILFGLFMDLIGNIEGEVVDVVLETSHTEKKGKRWANDDLWSEDMDPVTLRSNLYDFEDLLVNDGCTAISVLNPDTPVEVQFEEHKLLVIYGIEETLRSFREILHCAGVNYREDMNFILHEAHIHRSPDDGAQRFDELHVRLSGDTDF